MFISVAGNVGIGTTTINASSGYKMLRINGATTGGEIVLAGAEVEHAYMYASSGIFVIDAFDSKPMRFRTGNQNRIDITSGGNVLIGTTTDAGFKLDVAGTGRFTNTITSDITGGVNLALKSSNAFGGYIQFERSGSQIGYIGNAGSVTGANTDDMALRSQAAIRFSSGGNNLRMTIDSSGNIGAPTGTNIYNASDPL
jgi:hypothetical protein